MDRQIASSVFACLFLFVCLPTEWKRWISCVYTWAHVFVCLSAAFAPLPHFDCSNDNDNDNSNPNNTHLTHSHTVTTMSFAVDYNDHGRGDRLGPFDGKSAETRGLKDGEVSTGTTIMAIPFDGGVVLGADSRVSTGVYVANRVSDKIAQLSDHIFCCRSGSAADTQALTDYVKHFLSQLTIETGRQPTVKTAAHLMRRLCYQNKDKLMAGVIVAGWDEVDGGSVYNVPLGGTCIKMPFAIGGSGSTYIYGLVDSDFQLNMTAEQARTLVKKAVSHAMARDGSSGGVIRTVLVTAEGNDRDYTPGNQLPYGPAGW